jgi:hypothetical protein
MMGNKEKIDIARKNWMKASKELGFNIISPYIVIENDKEYVFFCLYTKI